MNKTFSIKEAVSFGWRTYKTNWKFWIVTWLILGTMSGGINSFTNTINSRSKQSEVQKIESNVPSVTVINNPRSDAQIGGVSLNNLTKDVLGAATDTQGPSTGQAIGFIIMGILFIVFGIILAVAFVLFVIFTVLVQIIFQMGYINLLLDAARGKPVYYKTLLNQVSFKKALKYLIASVLYTLIVFLGFLLFIIPGIYFALKYGFMTFAFVEGEGKIRASFSKSSALTKGIKLKMIGFGFVSLLICILGLLAGIVGIVPASITVAIAEVYIYAKMADSQAAPVNTEPTTTTPAI